MRHALLLIGLCCVPAVHVSTARADDALVTRAPVDVPEREARKRVAAFEDALRAVDARATRAERRDAELTALRALTEARHTRIARRLADAAADAALLPDTRIAALGALPPQGAVADDTARRVERWIAAAASAQEEALARGELGIPIDRRTGEPVTGTPEAAEALREGESEARVLAAGLTTLAALGHRPRKPGDLLRPFLESPYDELVVAAVDAARTWEAHDVLPELAQLLRMYPRENRWETGAVVHLAGTNASAKAAWMRHFGHPLKQRARPLVHRAVVACLSALAGARIETPEACDAWLAARTR